MQTIKMFAAVIKECILPLKNLWW